ncbi:MAG TPA: DUF4118 domain-containing protein, partial [Blastocatellia bacterium]|nr:DUF4118 domain-containing protein [Blastocatellia bacterium]
MPKLVHSHVLRYGLAVVSVTASMLLRIPLAEKLGSSVPFLFFFPALMVSGWYGGLGPGLLATLLSAAAAFYFILEPGYSFALTNAGDTFTLVLFIIVGVSMSLFSSQWQKAKESLRQSEERFAKAFQASPLALTITSLRTGRLLEVNETFTRLSGYTREEAIGHTTLELGLWSRPSDRDEELAIVSKRGQVRSMEYRFRMRDGRELVGLLSAEQIEIDGELCALTVIEDITEKTRVQAEREQLLASEQEARRQAEVANRMKDEFLATVSHELRTPLNAIMGWAGVLRRTNLNESDLSRAIRVIERNARSQSQLIDDLLDVSRIITGKLRIDLHPVDLTSVVEAA